MRTIKNDLTDELFPKRKAENTNKLKRFATSVFNDCPMIRIPRLFSSVILESTFLTPYIHRFHGKSTPVAVSFPE